MIKSGVLHIEGGVFHKEGGVNLTLEVDLIEINLTIINKFKIT
jgi:hypothetical protein